MNQNKSTAKIVFLTLFLDLVGFSIIFPLFPSLMEHYYKIDPDNFFLLAIIGLMNKIIAVGGVAKTVSPIVLFGGILGGIYSILQFFFAPFWGSLSDKIGRRPVLIISVGGMAMSYLLWIFSGSFTLFIIARVIGGLMSGNLSTATAVMGDITTEQKRSSGMAIIGIAFGVGFIVGPAIGGVSSLIRLDQIFPAGTAYGLNPFSAAALISFVMSTLNFIFIIMFLNETLPKEKRGQSVSYRTSNPVALFKPLSQKELNLTNMANFFFLIGFAGMEFTLTFLAAERLMYTPMKNSYMFIYLGVLMALIQGGFVRRKAHAIGEKKLATMGIIALIPGFFIIAFAQSNTLLYLGLTFLGIGSAMIMPCLTALISLFATPQTQGKAIGTFRSLGALSRVIGPFIASILYWRLGATTAYILGGLSLILPVLLLLKLPQPGLSLRARRARQSPE